MDFATVKKGTVLSGSVKKQKFLPFILWLHFKSIGTGLDLRPMCLCIEVVFAVGTRINENIKNMFRVPGRASFLIFCV